MSTTDTLTEDEVGFLTDVLCTAVEGGSNYWTEVHAYHWDTEDVELRGVVFRDIVEGKPLMHDIRLPHLKGGVLGLTKGGVVNTYITELLQLAWLTKDAGEVDAEVADCVLQYAVFEEVRYG